MAANEPRSERTYDLQQVSVARLLFELLSNRFTGELFVQHEDGSESSAGFAGGLPRWCRHTAPGTLLGDVLVALEAVDEDVLATALAEGGDQRLGERLVAEHSVDPQKVQEALRMQCERRLTQLCGAQRGSVRLVAAAEDHYTDYPDCGVLPVIRAGVMRCFSVEQVESALDGLADRVFAVSPSLSKYSARFHFSKSELAALKRLTELGETTFDEWLGEPVLSASGAQRLLCVLHICRMVQSKEASTSSDSPAEDSLVKPVQSYSSEQLPTLSSVARRRPADMPKGGKELAEYLASRWTPDTDAYAMLALSDDASLATIATELHRLREAIEPDEAQDGQEQDDPVLSAAASALDAMLESARAKREKICKRYGPILLREENWKQAVSLYEDLLQFHKGHVPTRVSLVWIRYQNSTKSQREAQLALDALERFLARDEALADAHYYRGHMLQALDRKRPAIAAFERALELDPSNVDAARWARALKEGKEPPKKSAKPKADKPRKKSDDFKGMAKRKKARHPYWSGPWPAIWIGTGVLLALMLAAQIVLRLDMEL